MFKLSNTPKTRARKTALLSTVILTLSFGSAFAVPNNSNQDNPFDDPQKQNTPFDGTAFVDFKDEAIVIPCLLVKSFNPGVDGSFYRVQMHPQHNLKASTIDWKIVAATPAPECKKQSDNPFDVVNDQPHDPEGKPQDNLPPDNNPPVNHQPNDQGKPHQDKPNQGKPDQDKPNKPKPAEVVNDQPHDPEGKPQDNLPPDNNPPVNHQPNDQGKPHQDKPNQGKPDKDKPNKPKPESEQPTNNDPAVQ